MCLPLIGVLSNYTIAIHRDSPMTFASDFSTDRDASMR